MLHLERIALVLMLIIVAASMSACVGNRIYGDPSPLCEAAGKARKDCR